MSNTDKSAPERIPCKACPWCGAEGKEYDEWGWLVTHEKGCYWTNIHGDPIGRVRVNYSEVEQWNRRADTRAVPADSAELLRQVREVIENTMPQVNFGNGEYMRREILAAIDKITPVPVAPVDASVQEAPSMGGPFRREGFKVIDINGRSLARISVSNRIPTREIENTGDLLAASWSLRELLRHVLTCSGSPSDCESCAEADTLSREERK